jgi:hypothetical protein
LWPSAAVILTASSNQSNSTSLIALFEGAWILDVRIVIPPKLSTRHFWAELRPFGRCEGSRNPNFLDGVMAQVPLGYLETEFLVPPSCSADFASFQRKGRGDEIIFVILVLALTAITFEISDVALTGAKSSHTAGPDAATVAVAHGLKRG